MGSSTLDPRDGDACVASDAKIGAAAALPCVGEDQLRARLTNADRLASIGQVAAGVAHELANPLAYLLLSGANLGNLCRSACEGVRALADLASGSHDVPPAALAELLSKHRLGEVVRELDALVADNADAIRRIGAIAADLRGFASTQPDGILDVELDDVVGVASRMLGPRIAACAHLVLELGELPAVRGSRGKLIQVVTNLLINATQAVEDAPPGKHEVRVKTFRCGADAVVVVEDTGIGIPLSVAPRVFEPLFTTKTRDRGTGLGLWVVDQIVHAHSGTIRFSSAAGRGTRFEVRLPLGAGGA